MKKSTSLWPLPTWTHLISSEKSTSLGSKVLVPTDGQITNFHSLRPGTGTHEASVLMR